VTFRQLNSAIFDHNTSSQFPKKPGSPVGGATVVLYARRSADGIFTGGTSESRLAQVANLFADGFQVIAFRKSNRNVFQPNPEKSRLNLCGLREFPRLF